MSAAADIRSYVGRRVYITVFNKVKERSTLERTFITLSKRSVFRKEIVRRGRLWDRLVALIKTGDCTA
jgi:hypothetical protein